MNSTSTRGKSVTRRQHRQHLHFHSVSLKLRYKPRQCTHGQCARARAIAIVSISRNLYLGPCRCSHFRHREFHFAGNAGNLVLLRRRMNKVSPLYIFPMHLLFFCISRINCTSIYSGICTYAGVFLRFHAPPPSPLFPETHVKRVYNKIY